MGRDARPCDLGKGTEQPDAGSLGPGQRPGRPGSVKVVGKPACECAQLSVTAASAVCLLRGRVNVTHLSVL